MRTFLARLLVLLPLLTPACAPESTPIEASAPVPAAPPATPPIEAAQDPAALPAGRALVERFLAVTKYEVVARSQSRHERAKLTLPIGSGTVESFSRRPMANRQRTDLGDFGSFENGLTGEFAWALLPGNSATLLEGIELLQTRLDGAYDAYAKPAELYESLTTLARVPYEGVDCYQVEVVARVTPGLEPEATKRARTSREYYEVESGHLRAQEGYAEGELSNGPYTRLFGEYREVAGTVVPTRVVLRKDALEVVTTLELLEFDTVRDEDLAPPRAIQRLIEAEAEPALDPVR